MRIGNYTAQIEPGTEDERGYIAMKMLADRSPFELKLTNHADRKCKVNVRMHGIDRGTWVLMPHQVVSIERPAYIAEKFCACAVGSEGGDAIVLTAGDRNNGLISITFTPAITPVIIPIAPIIFMPSQQRSRANFGKAGVGNEDASAQTFQAVDDFETDSYEAVTINLRIVELKNTPRLLSSTLSNPISPGI